MASVIVWLQANWLQLLVILLAVDQTLIAIFPSVAILGSVKDVLVKLTSGATASLK